MNKQSTKYFVIQEHTLVYEGPGGNLGVLYASILRGSVGGFPLGSAVVPRPMNPDHMREATLQDFKAFRVMPPPEMRE